LLAAGCQQQPLHFVLNFEGVKLSEYKEEYKKEIVNALHGLFGEPDKPYAHPATELDFQKIALASGPTGTSNTLLVTTDEEVYSGREVSRNEGKIQFVDLELGTIELDPAKVKATYLQRGLYRQHCIHCHGASGDGNGPTAVFLNPYPRDFRRGMFKFVSTDPTVTSPQVANKPAREDLRRVLHQGIAGTAMPSFGLLPTTELDALIEYVKYLGIRGETERQIYSSALGNEEFGKTENATREAVMFELADPDLGVVPKWKGADEHIIAPAKAPPDKHDLVASIQRGQKLFDSEVTKCKSCHGPVGLGDGELQLDAWNKEKKEQPDRYYSLPLQYTKPRNLHLGIYRGGRRPIDLYRRIYGGISPSGMPGFSKLQPEEIWDLVNFVRSISFEETRFTEPPVEAAVRTHN